MAVPVAGDSFFIPKSMGYGLPQSDPAIFDRVVIVDMSVTFALSVISIREWRELIQHMIKESHACVVGIASAAIKIDGDANFSLVCGSVNARCAWDVPPVLISSALYAGLQRSPSPLRTG